MHRLGDTLQKVFGQYDRFFALAGDGNGNVNSSRRGFVLARVPGFGIIEVYNKPGKDYRDGQLILVGRDSTSLFHRFCILDEDASTVLLSPGDSSGVGIETHGETHHLYGGDAVFMHSLQYTPFAPIPIQNSKSISVYGAFVVGMDGSVKYFPGQTIDLTPHFPSSGACFALLEYDYSSNSIVVSVGAVKSSRILLSFSDAPPVSTNRLPIALVVLDASLGKIVVSRDLELVYDLRFFRNYPGNFMTKDVYDQDNDGVVDDSERLGGVLPTSQGLALLDDPTPADQRNTLGLGSIATHDENEYMKRVDYDSDNDGIVDDSERLGGVLPTTQGLALLDDLTAADQRNTLGLGSIATHDETEYMKKADYDTNGNGVVDDSESTRALRNKPISSTLSPSINDVLFWNGSEFSTTQVGNLGPQLGVVKDYFVGGTSSSGNIGSLGWLLTGGSVASTSRGIIHNSPSSAGNSRLILGAIAEQKQKVKEARFALSFASSFTTGGLVAVGLFNSFPTSGTPSGTNGVLVYTFSTNGSGNLYITNQLGNINTNIQANISGLYVFTFILGDTSLIPIPVEVRIKQPSGAESSFNVSTTYTSFYIGFFIRTENTTVKKINVQGFYGVLDYPELGF